LSTKGPEVPNMYPEIIEGHEKNAVKKEVEGNVTTDLAKKR
jgi:hypothetical protein